MKNYIFCLVLVSTLNAWAGKDRGGVDPVIARQASVRQILQSGVLKTAIYNYFDTMDVSRVADASVKSFLSVSLPAVKTAIPELHFEISAECFDSTGARAAMSAEIGNLSAPICADVALIAQDVAVDSEENFMIRLASMAVHEVVHQLQNSAQKLETNEQEAYAVSSYVSLTAKTVQAPTLEWAMPQNVSSETLEISYRSTGSTVNGKLSLTEVPVRNVSTGFGWMLGSAHIDCTSAKPVLHPYLYQTKHDLGRFEFQDRETCYRTVYDLSKYKNRVKVTLDLNHRTVAATVSQK